MTVLDDTTFLFELIRQLDAAPGDRVSAQTVAAALEDQETDPEPIVQRLMARGLIDWAPYPRRSGEGWTDRGLSVTPAGYAQARR